MKKILITGANRGLGLAFIKKLSLKKDWEIYATARDTVSLDRLLQKDAIFAKTYTLCLSTTKPKVLQEMVLSINPSAIIHCASPYMTKFLVDTELDDLMDYSHCMMLDQVLLHTFVNKRIMENASGVFICSGAVIGRSHFNERGLMGLLKSHQRRLCDIANYECKHRELPIFIRHLDLGSFRDAVLPEESKQFISTDYVVDNALNILQAPEKFPHDVPIASESNELTYGPPVCQLET